MKDSQYDVMGQAGLDYLLNGQRDKDIKVWCDIAEDDTLPLHHLFRGYQEMPRLEQMALELSRGRVLDVGAGMGGHSLYLQDKGMDVTALEISPKCSEVISRRGLRQVINCDFFKLSVEHGFDTILLLMNGIGIVGTIDGFTPFFNKCRDLLNPGGEILLDSSDLRYLYIDEDGAMLINLNDRYYGEVEDRMSYGDIKGRNFKWLFIDEELMAYYADINGFKFEKIADGPHYDYLARLTIKEEGSY